MNKNKDELPQDWEYTHVLFVGGALLSEHYLLLVFTFSFSFRVCVCIWLAV